MRQAAAAAILAVVVGVGLFIIGQQFAVPAASDEEIALLPDERPPTAPRAADDPVETSAIPETTVAKTVEAPPLAITTGIDPGTLATPPLYEKPTPPSPVPDQSAAPELAAIPLRTDTAESVEAPAPGTAIVTEEPAVTEALSPAEDSPAEIAAASPAAETPAEPLRESVTIDTPPAKKATSTSEPSRSAVGSGKVNSAVNMRAGPDNNEKVVRVLRAGTPVEILNSCKVWCEVVANGDRGFIFQRFITRTGGGSAQAEPPEPAGGIVRTSLAEDTSVGSPDETGGPLNLLRFGRPNN